MYTTAANGPFFTDSKLQQLIKLTIDNNKDLELSALNLKKSGVQYGVERLSWLPAVSLTAEKPQLMSLQGALIPLIPVR
jgi:multidrug efflux system outer membrane protein